jgi:hypothetical protein
MMGRGGWENVESFEISISTVTVLGTVVVETGEQTKHGLIEEMNVGTASDCPRMNVVPQ